MMKTVVWAAALGALSAGKKTSDDDKCRVLSLRGGGVHGVWEAGVL